MFEIHPSEIFMIYLAATLAAILVVSIIHSVKQKKRKVLSSETCLYVCEYCTYAYLDKRASLVNRCPQCDSLNQHNQHSNL